MGFGDYIGVEDRGVSLVFDEGDSYGVGDVELGCEDVVGVGAEHSVEHSVDAQVYAFYCVGIQAITRYGRPGLPQWRRG